MEMEENTDQIRHDMLVSRLEKQLFYNHDYEKVIKFFEYCRNGEVGEVDLLAFADNIYDVYEIKCTRTQKSYGKTIQQYDKFKMAFPELETNGFLYTGNRGLERI